MISRQPGTTLEEAPHVPEIHARPSVETWTKPAWDARTEKKVVSPAAHSDVVVEYPKPLNAMIPCTELTEPMLREETEVVIEELTASISMSGPPPISIARFANTGGGVSAAPLFRPP